MSKNIYGIFASTIHGNCDTSVARLRKVITCMKHARNIMAVAVATICIKTGEDADVVEADINDCVTRIACRATMPVKLAMCALSQVESAYTVYHHIQGSGEGLESARPISDTRDACEVVEAVLFCGLSIR